MRDFLALGLAVAAAIGGASAAAYPKLPIVDLGYRRHKAISFNETGQTYNFTNIRYAQAPVGDLRWREPLPPNGKSSQLYDGSVGSVCPQGTPGWASGGKTPPVDPRTTEDCLFLDVIAPKKLFDRVSNTKRDYPVAGAPVLVWIYGGGYTNGEKTGNGVFNPAGLLRASDNNFVYVAMNYRLGALGFLAGPTLQSDGIANLGLYDQRLALEWIQKNIHLFGGDKNRVTVIGESAGGGSIMHQITAFAGLKGPVPFSQAIIQSAAWQPQSGSNQQELLTQTFLKALNVSTIAEARSVSTEKLISANQATIFPAPVGSFAFGPVVDGLFAPNQPGRLLLQGTYDRSVKVMSGYNSNEAVQFTDPRTDTTEELEMDITEFFPNITPPVLKFITGTLYPPIFDGSYGYTTQLQRAVLLTADSSFTCNTDYLNRAFKENAFAYQFAVPPGIHGLDIPYTFLNGISPVVTQPGVARVMQEYFASFTMTGQPVSKRKEAPAFPNYAAGGNEVRFNNDSSIIVAKDGQENPKCAWWQLALYA